MALVQRPLSFCRLPDDIVLSIAEFLLWSDRVRLSNSCRLLQRLVGVLNGKVHLHVCVAAPIMDCFSRERLDFQLASLKSRISTGRPLKSRLERYGMAPDWAYAAAKNDKDPREIARKLSARGRSFISLRCPDEKKSTDRNKGFRNLHYQTAVDFDSRVHHVAVFLHVDLLRARLERCRGSAESVDCREATVGGSFQTVATNRSSKSSRVQNDSTSASSSFTNLETVSATENCSENTTIYDLDLIRKLFYEEVQEFPLLSTAASIDVFHFVANRNEMPFCPLTASFVSAFSDSLRALTMEAFPHRDYWELDRFCKALSASNIEALALYRGSVNCVSYAAAIAQKNATKLVASVDADSGESALSASSDMSKKSLSASKETGATTEGQANRSVLARDTIEEEGADDHNTVEDEDSDDQDKTEEEDSDNIPERVLAKVFRSLPKSIRMMEFSWDGWETGGLEGIPIGRLLPSTNPACNGLRHLRLVMTGDRFLAGVLPDVFDAVLFDTCSYPSIETVEIALGLDEIIELGDEVLAEMFLRLFPNLKEFHTNPFLWSDEYSREKLFDIASMEMKDEENGWWDRATQQERERKRERREQRRDEALSEIHAFAQSLNSRGVELILCPGFHNWYKHPGDMVDFMEYNEGMRKIRQLPTTTDGPAGEIFLSKKHAFLHGIDHYCLYGSNKIRCRSTTE